MEIVNDILRSPRNDVGPLRNHQKPYYVKSALYESPYVSTYPKYCRALEMCVALILAVYELELNRSLPICNPSPCQSSGRYNKTNCVQLSCHLPKYLAVQWVRVRTHEQFPQFLMTLTFWKFSQWHQVPSEPWVRKCLCSSWPVLSTVASRLQPSTDV